MSARQPPRQLHDRVSYSLEVSLTRFLTVLLLIIPVCHSLENVVEEFDYCSSTGGLRVCRDCSSTYYDVSLVRCCWDPIMFEACALAVEWRAAIQNTRVDGGDTSPPINEERRAKYFLGKRDIDKKWSGPRNNFLGKREPEVESIDNDYAKRAKPFLGKRTRPFLG